MVSIVQPYFCGQSDGCLDHRSQWALDRAKENIEKSYPVVGVLEMLETTLEVMEAAYPELFKGLGDFYHSKNKKGMKKLLSP